MGKAEGRADGGHRYACASLSLSRGWADTLLSAGGASPSGLSGMVSCAAHDPGQSRARAGGALYGAYAGQIYARNDAPRFRRARARAPQPHAHVRQPPRAPPPNKTRTSEVARRDGWISIPVCAREIHHRGGHAPASVRREYLPRPPYARQDYDEHALGSPALPSCVRPPGRYATRWPRERRRHAVPALAREAARARARQPPYTCTL
ncbi:hypothetical protein B0H17DRAFT_339044 [Mycena rosella]|uniref:Uncharacterized protein n=1 Tax=Mycena rosella TaxID=1033263 RepID=A0AAD7CRS1_MYCRO|nr:hypothetical protein B0H17DRAFT_339044 [Mycena rosella]